MNINSPHASHSVPLNSSAYRSPPEPLEEHQNLKQESSDRSTASSAKEDSETVISEQRVLQQLKSRDREVRAHELAHVSVGARFVTSGAQFSYQKGSDGRLYAIGGEVSIDTSAVPGNPEATIQKSQVIARAALAPANPSSQDRQVAAQAISLGQQARVELASIKSVSDEDSKGNNIDQYV